MVLTMFIAPAILLGDNSAIDSQKLLIALDTDDWSAVELTRPKIDNSKEPIVPLREIMNIEKEAIMVGYLMACAIEWEDYYLAFMQTARRKENWSQKQIAFIGQYFGANQQVYYSRLKGNFLCDESTKLRVKEIKSARLGDFNYDVKRLKAHLAQRADGDRG